VQLLWRYRPFGWLWLGQLLSQFGNAIFLIMGLWEIELRSPFLLSFAGLAMTVPALFMMLGGVVVDRYHPVRLMLGTDTLRGLAVGLGLLALAVPGSLAWTVIALLFINSLGGALFAPAEAVVLPRLVADADLPGANGLYSLTSLLSGAVGSAIGGAAVVAIGVRRIFGLDMASFWLSALALWLVLRALGDAFAVREGRRDTKEEGGAGGTAGRSRGLLGQLAEGWATLRGFSWLLRLLPLILVANFAYQAGFTMLPYWSRQHLHANAVAFGLIDAAWATGMVVGSLVVGRLGRWPLGRTVAVIGLVQGLMTLAFAWMRAIPESIGFLFLAGIANGATNALIFTLLQRTIPEAVRGRAFGLFVSLLAVTSPLGSLAAGLVLHILPLAWSWDLGGLTVLALAAVLWRTRIEEASFPSADASRASSG